MKLLKNKGSVIYIGMSYYNNWYLSRELRKKGWTTLLVNNDANPESQKFYHGYDHKLEVPRSVWQLIKQLFYFIYAPFRYKVFHFTGVRNITYLPSRYTRGLHKIWPRLFPEAWDIRLLRFFGRKIVYSYVGCLDGVSQTSFSKWGPEPVCNICPWKFVPAVCSDEGNLKWGKLRNELSDYLVLTGGNRADYNLTGKMHEVPEFYCLDSNVWNPNLTIPKKRRLNLPKGTVKLFHTVGNFSLRTKNGVNIKSTHIYLPLIEKLKSEGYKIELIFPRDIPNLEIRYLQVQADIILDMLSFGWFGATSREGMMLGKPVICYLNPEFLEIVRKEIPDYVNGLPIISATPQNVREVLIDLITNPKKRIEIGRQSREFALKWHSAEVSAKRFDSIYSELLGL